MRVLRTLWNGEYSLFKAFWGFYVLGSIVISMVGLLIAAPFLFLHLRPLAVLILAVIYLGYWGVASVGVWRSANAYPYTRWWPNFAKIVVVIFVLRWLWFLWNGAGVALIEELTG